MKIQEIISRFTAGEVAEWALILIIIVMSLIEFSPLKINPWDNIFGWFGRKINGAMEKRLSTLEKEIREMWVQNHRNAILTFAREARSGLAHSSDEFANVLNIAEEYERYVSSNSITNGIITQDTEYIRGLYQELSREHRI